MGSLNKTPGRCEVVLESNVLLAFSGYIFGESGMKDITREIQLVSSIDIESRDIEEINEAFFTLLDYFIEGVFKCRESSLEPVHQVVANVLISLFSTGECDTRTLYLQLLG
jgi:hypothetical protein